MTLPEAVVLFDVVAFATLGLDFVLVRRGSPSIVGAAPAVVMAIALIAVTTCVDHDAVQVGLIGATVMGAALFGYANFNAFVKRGITFSILHNHTQPRRDRRPDRDFIAIEERLEEMRGHGWLGRDGNRWRLTGTGHRVVRLRRALLRLLRVEAVG